jgi:UDP-N-acetylmuramoyl-L-alanyl-D-glutamate--2,6-diaminopimelate ligase
MAVLPSATLIGEPDTIITDVTDDSRSVRPGALFAAVKGLQADGQWFIPQAVSSGAAAVMIEGSLESDPGLPVIQVGHIRSAMSLAAAAAFDFPADHFTMIGVTGTNGKTTTCFLIEAVLKEAGRSPGVLGTVSVRFAGRSIMANMTTPEGPELQRYFRDMRDNGVDGVVMEVSSHALELGRVQGCRFDAALFTNLTQDHLDFHGEMEGYFKAKRLLFTEYLTGSHLKDGPVAVINTDDDWGKTLAAEHTGRTLTYGLESESDIFVEQVRSDRSGIAARLRSPYGDIGIQSRMIGRFNLSNLLAAASVCLAMGISPEVVRAGLSRVTGAPGRIERVNANDDYLVLVDYAHTPDALKRVLAAARDLEPKRLLTVFGAGGDRDPIKRPLMGMAAGHFSDLAIITSDNPRTEDPLAIIEQIEPGLIGLSLKKKPANELHAEFESGTYTIEPDRRSAIALACRLMQPGDIAVIAGKGHEDYQIIGREKIHLDDREEAKAALERENKF